MRFKKNLLFLIIFCVQILTLHATLFSSLTELDIRLPSNLYPLMRNTSFALWGLIASKSVYDFYSWYKFKNSLEDLAGTNKYTITTLDTQSKSRDMQLVETIATNNYLQLWGGTHKNASEEKINEWVEGIKSFVKGQAWHFKSKVICDKQTPCGFISYDVVHNHINLLGIQEDFRRKKLASILLNTILKELTQSALFPPSVTIMVHDDNVGAQNLYKQHNFKKYGTSHNDILLRRHCSFLEFAYLKLCE
jgi:ribosomal protein S18 acetylase RimI-like enzyme